MSPLVYYCNSQYTNDISRISFIMLNYVVDTFKVKENYEELSMSSPFDAPHAPVSGFLGTQR